jgi:WD40 repeat protein/tRNA A-37 threonylcarbamoyl transferase component Bud32
MLHPTLEALLEASAESALHLEGCDDCRRMSLLLAAAGSGEATPPALPLTKVPLVERRCYVDWEELPEAHGGMGRLFRAFDTRLGREVAVKQVRAAQDLKLGAFHRALLHRLEREARLTARLQHPNIVVIYEVGRFEDGELFYSMPLVHGRPLSREIEKRSGLAERIGLLAQVTNVAEAIAYSHSAGVLHRDVKPENVLIGAFGESVLIDWGLAKEIDAPEIDLFQASGSDPGLTQLGIGTPQYMAPEQARGEPPTPAVDIYALGATLYHVLAGAPPYGLGDAREVRRLLLQGPPRPLAELQPATPPELLHICARAMGRTPGQRYSSARELVDELRRFQTGRLLGSRRYSAAELLKHWAHKHRTLLLTAAAALLVLFAVTALGVLQIDRHRRAAEQERARAEWSLRRAQGVLASKLAAEPRERLAALELAVQAAAPELLGIVPGTPSQEARQALFDALAGPAMLLLNHSGSVTNFAVSPGGTLLAGTGDDRKLFLWNARSGRRLAVFDSRLERPHQVRFSPDGRWLSLCGGQPGAELFEVASGKRTPLPTRLPPWCEFAADGTFVTAAEDLVLHDPATGSARRFELPRPSRRLAAGKAGTLAVALNDGSMRVFSGGAFRELAGPGAISTSIAFDGSGSSLTLIRTGGEGLLWSTEGWAPRQISWSPPGHAIASRARFAPGGALLAVPLWGEEAVRTLVFDAKTGEQVADVPVFAQEWAGPDRFFADARGPLQLIDARDGQVALTLRGHRDEVKAAAWLGDAVVSASRDHDEFLWDLSGLFLGHTGEVVGVSLANGRLLSAGLDGTVRLWSASGKELWTLRQGSAATRASFSADGASVLAGFLDGEVRLMETASGTSRVLFHAAGPVTVARLEGRHALVAALDGSLAWIDVQTGASRTFDPHGAILAAGGGDAALVTAYADGSVRLWDLEGKERAAVRGQELFVSVAIQGERVLLSRPDGRTRILKTRDLSPLGELDGRAADSGNAFSRDGHLFAAIAGDGRILVHDLTSGAKHDAGRGRGIALATAFSPDGALLASGGLDGVLRVVDWQGSALRAQLDAGEGPLTALAFAEDGRTIFAGYASGALRAFPASAEAAFERACSVLRRFEQPAYCDRTAASPNQMRDR